MVTYIYIYIVGDDRTSTGLSKSGSSGFRKRFDFNGFEDMVFVLGKYI